MLQRLTIDRFRGFEHLDVRSFERVNLIAGRNNTGKTALLEAIFLLLAPTHPDLATSFAHRGQELTPPNFSYEAEWQDLFHGRDADRPVRIDAALADRQHGLEINLRDALTEVNAGPIGPTGPTGPWSSAQSSGSTTPAAARELVYDYSLDGDLKTQTVASARPTGLYWKQLVLSRETDFKPALPRGAFLSTSRARASELAEWLTRIREQRLQHEVEDVLRHLDPRLQSLVVTASGGRPSVSAELAGGQTMPLRMMGEGFSRALELLLGIYDTEGGIVLVDEVENGLHYSTLSTVWSAVAVAARRSNAQVIATTHSWECIRAAHETFSADSTYDFKLHRLDMSDVGNVSVTTYDREMVDTSLAMGLEVR